VIAVGLRGYGDSSIPRDGDYTAETVSEDLAGVLVSILCCQVLRIMRVAIRKW
jgi:hypothetical protein